MRKDKTSRAVIKTARLNPINPEEKRALDHLRKMERQGFNFKQVVVDAINYRDGATPEMFTHDDHDPMTLMEQKIERLFSQLAAELVSKIGNGEVRLSDSLEEDASRDDGVSAFTRNFARGLLQRQEMTMGSTEEEE